MASVLTPTERESRVKPKPIIGRIDREKTATAREPERVPGGADASRHF